MKTPPIIIAPSLLSADMCRLGDELKRIEAAGCEWVHIDLFDGRFAPNLSFGPKTVEDLRRRTELFLDVHLMLFEPLPWAERFAGAGADQITIHEEADGNTAAALEAVRAAGCRVGLALKPDAPGEASFPYLEKIDLLLPMTVYPGFSGQRFLPEVVQKIALARDEIDRRGLPVIIQADGGVSAATAPALARAGVSVFVAGSALFGADNLAAAADNIRRAAAKAQRSSP